MLYRILCIAINQRAGPNVPDVQHSTGLLMVKGHELALRRRVLSTFGLPEYPAPILCTVHAHTPCATATKSGSADWTTAKRREFATDLVNPQLIAVTDNANQEKSDSGPEEWKTPHPFGVYIQSRI
ncbi:predicted protein [Histoplasma mississippiense (nom. inval.)]|uniref:predicted protein n=1 Tax=Ajellomyces capsulatus (strain NAm1 / WU24) TaxID=2059318 RepID=UPI000157BFE5|nr:predicted protein [Histoplasma mississippiense (nom. inval.)]EDN07046.1 predicted protein [Histoplasma mississippiense (nom. inval.)]